MFPLTVGDHCRCTSCVRDLGLTNNLGGVILPQIGFELPITIIILVPFLTAIPASWRTPPRSTARAGSASSCAS